ncbi:MAG: MT-A70 family methyltransferase, partial [Promethearchaeota archaeon]
WARSQHELLLIGTMGKFSPPNIRKNKNIKLPTSVFRHKRGKHSQKPSLIRNEIDKLFPDGERIELFARTLVEAPIFDISTKWDCWGNEYKKINLKD